MKIIRGKNYQPHAPSSTWFAQEARELMQFMMKILIVHLNHQVRCLCFNQITSSVNAECPYCLGTGWIPSIEIHHSYSISSSIPETNSRQTRTAPYGGVSVDARKYYLMPESNVKVSDLIVEFDNNALQHGLINSMLFYEVNHVDLKRDEFGTLIYNLASTEKDPIESEIKAINLYAFKDGFKYIPVIK